MLGMGRRDGSVELKPTVKNVLAQTPTRPGAMSTNTPTNTYAGTAQRSSMPPPVAPQEHAPPTVQVRETPPPVAAAAAPLPPVTASTVADTPGSKLFVGANIKLKGVEISDCDVLIVEGHVEATVFSKGLQITQPGTLNGTVAIDVAEILGTFSGELTARTRLVVHGSGRVSGKIRYGKLVVEEGGELTGDVRQLDRAEDQPQLSLTSGPDARSPLGVQTRGDREAGASK